MEKSNKSSGYNNKLKRSWVEQFYEEIKQVQQRFNYFLIATSFLLLAFLTMITRGFPDIELMGDVIVHITAIFGMVFSLYFLLINYNQARVANEVSEKKITEPILGEDIKVRIGEAIGDAFCYFFKAREFTTKRRVSYTWFIPFAFLILWFVIWLSWVIGQYIVN
jgi:hypothetical protein